MLFLSRTFCSARNTLDYTATNVANINLLILQDGIFDEIHITKDTAFENNNIIKPEWTYDTILHAHFNGDLHGGNVSYTADQVSAIRIKRRVKNTYRWITLYEIPITTWEDFQPERFDKYAKGCKTEYEYAIVPILNGAEGNLNTNSVISDFDGVYIMKKEQAFSAILDIDINMQKNKPTSTFTTLGAVYPYVVSNGAASYYSGNVTATFIEYDEVACDWKVREGFAYRERLMEYLANGKPKFIKFADGRACIVKIVDSIPETVEGHPDYVRTSINFVEVGNVASSNDLYYNNFIDVNVEGS